MISPRLSPARLGLLGGLPLLAAVCLAGVPSQAQSQAQPQPQEQAQPQAQEVPQLDPFARVRAINTARNAAVKLNGGLSKYRPAACMFATDIVDANCLVQRDAEGFLYRFQGGAPGWQQLGLPATTETELLVSPDGRSVVRVIYNGAPR